MPNDLLLELTRRYLEPHRHYHSLEHIAQMLHLGRDLQLDDGQVMAVWFHDAVYDPRSRTNEQDSAALAKARLAAIGWPEPACARVAAIVLDTQTHEPSSPDSAPVLDLDLASLALPWDEFARNTVRIRAEYAHVGDADFAAGRAKFFQAMLQRPRLYFTPFGARFEAPARANMQRALQGAPQK
jgi:predicted metal-dependent HD superfamily phosphohydrolase